MKKYIVFICIVLFIVACSGNKSSNIDMNNPEAVLKLGKEIYKERCVICHGAKGDMGLNGAFNLQTSALNETERTLIIKKGRGVMPLFGNILDENEIKAVTKYTMTFKK